MSDGSLTVRLWDVFICYASEDRENVVRPLADMLRREGVSVWLDEFEIELGQSIVGKIERGLANSQAGIVVISPHSREKNLASIRSARDHAATHR